MEKNQESAEQLRARRERAERDVRALAQVYSENLKNQIEGRTEEMEQDDISHFLIYRVLGISEEEGRLIDVYQNKGRFLYKYAGAFLEEAAIVCLKSKFPDAKAKVKIANPAGSRPKTFEMDFLVADRALEIKWRDATTDGDHITKEHARIRAISESGLKPIRVMFYYPNRDQAKRIQETIRTIYGALDGEYHAGDDAWAYIESLTDIDLLGILERVADENTGKK